MKSTSKLLRLPLWGAAFLCLTGWLLVRLWVPLTGHVSGKLLAPAAALLAVLLLLVWHRLGLNRRLLPTVLTPAAAVTAVLAFLLGALFDISGAMPGVEGTLVSTDPFRLLCRLGSGLILAVIALTLLRAARDMKGLGRISWKQLLVLVLLVNGLTLLNLATSRTVYIWDTAGYWSVARALAQEPLSLQQLRAVLATTITLDYNHLLAWPISLLMRIFGGSRAVFLLAIANLYTLPGLWGMAAMARDRKWGGVTLAALLPMFAVIGVIGFVDVAAASLAVWAFVIYTSDRPAVSRGSLAGALTVGTFLLRRYFFFFAVSFGMAALLEKLLSTLLRKRKALPRPDWSDFLSLFFSCGVCAVYFTYVFLLEKVLGSHYGDLYSAYALGLKTDVLIFFRYFGLVLPLLALWFLRKTPVPRRRGAAIAALQIPLCFLLFTAIQTHGQQHLLLYLPAFALLMSQVPALPARVLAAVTLVLTLIPTPQPASIQEIRYPAPLPSFHFYGQRRSDADQLLALAEYIDSLSAEEPHTAAVLASSFRLNSETITNLYPSFNLPEPEVRTTIYSHGTVDKRDGFNWNTAFADYLIIGDPIQTHLGEENQQVMALLARQVLEGTGAGAAYSPLPVTFSLADGCTVRIYHRDRDWTYDEFRAVSDPLTALYPDYAAIYAIPDWITP